MVFSSLNFIFIFLPLFLFAYYVTPAAFRNSTLFAGSILFYAAGVIKQPYALFLLMVLTYLNYVFGIRLYQIHNPRKKKLFLTKVIFFDFLFFLFIILGYPYIFNGNFPVFGSGRIGGWENRQFV